MRHRADGNQPEIIEAFEMLGCSVVNLSQVGNACPDIAVSLHGFTEFVEIKSEAGRLSPEQIRFRRESKGVVHEVRNVDDVQRVVESMKRKMRRSLLDG